MDTRHPKIGCVVVLYYPDSGIEQKLNRYASKFSHLCIIDNSEEPAIIPRDILATPGNKIITYIHNKNQGGIARALNLGVNETINRGFTWVMTLDQDSEPAGDMLKHMWQAIAAFPNHKLGIISPHHLLSTDQSIKNKPEHEFVLFSMTSGNLLNIQAYKKTGPFDEKLFIDSVDHDYCLRLQIRGYKVLKANKAILQHTLGQGINHTFLGRTEVSSNHPPHRRYYITRNRLYVAFKYRKHFPTYFKREIRHIFRDTLMIIFCEDKKVEKLRMILRGIIDYRRRRFGELSLS